MIELLTPDQYREAAWRNGGGITHEIAAEAGTSPLWRLSVATIDRDGPFSDYAGYDRTIVPLDGEIELTIDGTTERLAPHTPFEFRGESTVACRVLGGRARDLNVMTARNEYAHDVEIVRGRTVFLVDDDELVFVYALDGGMTVDGVAASRGDTVYLDSVERVEIVTDPDAHACVIRVTPR